MDCICIFKFGDMQSSPIGFALLIGCVRDNFNFLLLQQILVIFGGVGIFPYLAGVEITYIFL